jgi:4-hydroxybenzoate polyprenyltransferase
MSRRLIPSGLAVRAWHGRGPVLGSQGLGPVAAGMAIVRLSRPRYLALTVPPFLIAALGSGGHAPGYLLLGTVAIVLLRSISSIGNCISDRREDEVDHPERSRLCAGVGYRRLRRTVADAVAIYLLLLAAMVATGAIGVLALALWLLFLLLKLSYSFGPRLKPRRFSATGLLGGLSAGMFAAGWAGSGLHSIRTGLVAVSLLWAMGATLSGSKDVPNLEGDLSIGYRSVYWEVLSSRRPLARALSKASLPFLLVLAYAAGGFPRQILWCLAAYPFTVAFTLVLVRARTAQERSLVRECGYLYWLIFMGAALLALFPAASTLAIALGGLLWYIAASLLAHPDPTPLDGGGARRVLAVLAEARRS